MPSKSKLKNKLRKQKTKYLAAVSEIAFERDEYKYRALLAESQVRKLTGENTSLRNKQTPNELALLTDSLQSN